MHLMEPNLKMGRDVWDRINMPPEEFERRIEGLTRGMDDLGVGALVLYGSLVNHYGHPAYLCNFLLRMSRGAVALLTRGGELTLIFEGIPRGINMAKAVSHVEDVRSGRNMAVETINVLTEKKLIPGKVGFAGIRDWMPHHQARHLTETLGPENMVDAEPLMERARRVKSPREQDQVRRAARIAAQTLRSLEGLTATGGNGRTLDARLKREARIDGAEDIRVALAMPKQGDWSLGPADETPLSDGDTIIVVMAVEFERYWGQAARTFQVRGGALQPAENATLEKLMEGYRAALQPGRAVAEIAGEVLDALKGAGLNWVGDYGLGEGLGLGPFEHPRIEPGEVAPLEEGTCLAIRLTVEDSGTGAAMVGHTVRITPGGAEILTA